MRRTTASAYTIFGVMTTLFWFVLIPQLSSWRPSRLTLGSIVAAVAVINIAGLVYLVKNYRIHPRWLVVAGIFGNGLSLFVIVYAAAGLIFLEYFFRM
jgi:hypothetical protein